MMMVCMTVLLLCVGYNQGTVMDISALGAYLGAGKRIALVFLEYFSYDFATPCITI